MIGLGVGVGVVHGVHQREVRDHHHAFKALVVDGQYLPRLEGFVERLGDEAVAVDVALVGRAADAFGGPVDRLRLGDAPVHFAVLAVEFEYHAAVESEALAQQFGAQIVQHRIAQRLIGRRRLFQRGRKRRRGLLERRVQRGIIRHAGFGGDSPQLVLRRICPQKLLFPDRGRGHLFPLRPVAEDSAHLKSEPVFVVKVRVVHHVAELVHEDPRQLLVEHRIVRVVLQRPVADQRDPLVDPPPAVREAGAGDGDVVGHVPREVRRSPGEGRLQIGDPARELDHLVVTSLVLERAGAQPEQVRHQSAETAQRYGGEYHQRRSVFDLPGETQAVFRHLSVQVPLDGTDPEKHRDGDADEQKVHRQRAESHFRITSPSSRRQ